jgi:DNA helicase-2/ATP-dependent DNA helicase PcrA
MGVSAVPGSGKTWTLSMLAAKLVAEGSLDDDQEILVVTLVNSAVSNFSGRVGRFIQERGLLPNLGYRVRTLHGLCHDIVRERPALVNLSDDFQIIDERAAEEVLQNAATAWLREHSYTLDELLSEELDEQKAEWVRKQQLPDLVIGVASAFIKQAKDLQLTPAELRYRLDSFPEPLPLLEMGWEIYADYQRSLSYRGAVDFDDLIWLALTALKLDNQYLERLRHRWPYILEDEAQDSSRLQEAILRQLCGPSGNWVRVGDPNQAIYETFTTASPKFLKDFLEEEGVLKRDLPNSGRSMQSIITLANTLIDWTRELHPVEAVRDALDEPYIKPSPAGDPQPNPPDDPAKVRFITARFNPQEELAAVVDSLQVWLPEHPEETVAVLVPRNQRGFELATLLKTARLPYVELLRSTPSTRETAGALGNVVSYLADPTSTKKLSTVYRVWRRKDREDEALRPRLEEMAKLLRKCDRVEDFLWPRADRDWLADLGWEAENPELHEHLAAFRDLVRRWQEAAALPIDQLILTLAQDLFDQPVDLAIAHKLALVLRRSADASPDKRLPDLVATLAEVARNERKFLGLSEEDTGFDPEAHKGKVVIITVHKAKGLEWDKVYLISANTYDYPAGLPGDTYISEKWFIRDHLNVQAEVLAQLAALRPGDNYYPYDEGQATQASRIEYAAERLRLFYVGITRARKELIVTWNTGRRGDQQPSVPFIALQAFWEQRTG